MNLTVSNGLVVITNYNFKIQCANNINFYITGLPFYHDKELGVNDTSIGERDILSFISSLTGNFYIIKHDQKYKEVTIITDHGNSYHPYVYFTKCKKSLFISNKIEDLYNLIPHDSNLSVDYVSIIDYMINRSITYPYTLYNNVKALDFASVSYINYNFPTISFKSRKYWQPTCQLDESNNDIGSLSSDLRTNIFHVINTSLRTPFYSFY